MKTIGPFQVLRQLGSGGMGAVYAVRHPHHDRPLALKLILPHVADATTLLRFQREAEVMARVRHPGVMVIHQVGQSPEGPFLVSELIEGRSLDERLRAGPLDPKEAAQLTRSLADAMVAVHAAGVVHRDLKPSNVMLREDGSPVVLDFGIAQDESAEALTKTGTMLGSPHYMSPEQCDGDTQAMGPRSDVYGLGAILYTLLCGERPFGSETGLSLVRAVLLGTPTPPRQVAADVPTALEAICLKAMANAPDERYASMKALRDDLDRYLTGERVEAPLSEEARPKRWPLLVAVALGLVAALVAGAVSLRDASTTPLPPPPEPSPAIGAIDSEELLKLSRIVDAKEFERALAEALRAYPDDARLADLGQARTELEALLARKASFTLEGVDAWRTRYPDARVPRKLRNRFLLRSLALGETRVIGVHDAKRGRMIVVGDEALSFSPEGAWGIARWSLTTPAPAPLETLGQQLRLSVRTPFLERGPTPRLMFLGDQPRDDYHAIRVNPKALKADLSANRLPLLPDEAARGEENNEQGVIASSPDGSLIAVGFRSGRLDLFDGSLKLLASKKRAHPYSLNSLTFPSNTRLVTSGGFRSKGATLTGHLQYWDVSTPRDPKPIGESPFGERFGGETFLLEATEGPNGEAWLVVGVHVVRALFLYVCEPEGLRRVKQFPGATFEDPTAQLNENASMDSPPYAAVFSPDRKRLYASGGLSNEPGTGELRVWDVETQTEIAIRRHHDSENLTSIGLTADGCRLITGATVGPKSSRRLTIESWDVDLPGLGD